MPTSLWPSEVTSKVNNDCEGTREAGGTITTPTVSTSAVDIVASTKAVTRVRVRNTHATQTAAITVTGGHVEGSPGLAALTLGQPTASVPTPSYTAAAQALAGVGVSPTRAAQQCVTIVRRPYENLVVQAQGSGAGTTLEVIAQAERPDLVAKGI